MAFADYDIDLIRGQFPALAPRDDGPEPVFFDNPGGTQVPRAVVEAVTRCLTEANANLGGARHITQKTHRNAEEAHLAMADFVNARSPREIVFGQNMTTLTFQMARSIGRRLSPGDEIVLTRMEHDANVAPWLLMARDHGLEVKFLAFETDQYEFDLRRLDSLLTKRTRLICFNHASNLTGTINDVKSVSEKAAAVGAWLYVDSVQYAPHGSIDVQALGCDFLVCSPYKFFGPHMGVLWGREDLLMALDPYKVRTAGEGSSDRFETGTLSHEGMAGTTAAVDYFAWVGRELAGEAYRARHGGAGGRRTQLRAAMDYLFDYERSLTVRLIEGLRSLPGVTVHGITNPNAMARRVPTVSFTAEGRRPRAVAEALAAEEIYVWDGHNYALEPTRSLGLLDAGGVVRVGLAHYNTQDEVDRGLEKIEAHLRSA